MVKLVPMTQEAFEDYLAKSLPAYAADKVVAQEWPSEKSSELARKELSNMLPKGVETSNNFLFSIENEERKVGMIWFAKYERHGVPLAYLCDIYIENNHRRRGFASSAIHAVEEKAKALGLSGIVLHVFGHNESAQGLYEKLGYQKTNIMMFKEIDVV